MSLCLLLNKTHILLSENLVSNNKNYEYKYKVLHIKQQIEWKVDSVLNILQIYVICIS